MLWNVSALVLSYLLGSVPWGYIVVKLARGADVRGSGSGSTGATNVTRSAGLKAGAVTYLLDVLKGVAAVLVMRALTDDPLWLGGAAVAAILGHMFPVFLGFKGGKGVATGVGTYLPLVPLPVVTTLVVWGLVFWRTRTVSLASIVATALVPVWIFLYWWLLGTPADPVRMALAVGAGCALVILKHYENVRRLIAGTESRFERRSAAAIERAAADEARG